MTTRRNCCCKTSNCCSELNYNYNYALFDEQLEKYENITPDADTPTYGWVVKAKGLNSNDVLIMNMPACEAGGDLLIQCPQWPASPPPCVDGIHAIFGRLSDGTLRNNDIRVKYKHLKCYWVWYGKPYAANFDPNIPFCTATSAQFYDGSGENECFLECFLNQYQEPCKCPVCCQLGETIPSVGQRLWLPRWTPYMPAMTEDERNCCGSSFYDTPIDCENQYMLPCMNTVTDPDFCEAIFELGDDCKTCNLSPYLRRISQEEFPWLYDIYCYNNNLPTSFGVHYNSQGAKVTTNVRLQDIFLGFAFVEHQYQQVDVRFEDLNNLPKIAIGPFGEYPTDEPAVTPTEKRDSWFYFNQRTTPNMFSYAGSGTPIFHFDVYFAEQCGIFDVIEDPATGDKLTPIEFIRRFANAGCTYRLYGSSNPAGTPGYSTLNCEDFSDYYAPIQQALEYMMEAGIVGTTDYRLRMIVEIYEILTSIQSDGTSYFTPWARNPSFKITVSAADVALIKARIGYSSWSGPDDIYTKTATELGFSNVCYAPCRKMLLPYTSGSTTVQPRFNPNHFPFNSAEGFLSQNQTSNLQATTVSNYSTQAAYFGMQGFFKAQKGGWNFYKFLDGCGLNCGGDPDPCSELLLAAVNAEKSPDAPIIYGNSITGFLERNWLAKESYQRSYRSTCTTLSLLPPFNGDQFSNESVGGGIDPCNSNRDFVWIANGIPSLRQCIPATNIVDGRCPSCQWPGIDCQTVNGCDIPEPPPGQYYCLTQPTVGCDDYCGHVGFYGNEDIFVNSFSKYAPAYADWDCTNYEGGYDPDNGVSNAICAHSFTCYSYVAFYKRYAEVSKNNKDFVVYENLSTPWMPTTGFTYDVTAPLHRVPTQTNKALCGLRCGCTISSSYQWTQAEIAGPGGVGVCGWCDTQTSDTPPFYVIGGPTELNLSDDYSEWNF